MIKESLLKTPYLITRFPSLPCPRCNASLVIKEDKKVQKITAQSDGMMEHAGNDPDYYRAVGSYLLECISPNCREAVICSGLVSMMEDSEDYEPNPRWIYQIEPRFFFPPIHFISVPDNLPKSIAASLTDSFALFWFNPSAAGNSLRILVEHLMNHERVTKSYRDKHQKRRMYTLHDRIALFKVKHLDLANKLLAIKWIGNNGSHVTGLTREGLLKAFRILEHVLEEIFEKKSKALAKLVSSINKKKGRI